MPPRRHAFPSAELAEACGFAELGAGDLEALERLDEDLARLAAERLEDRAAPEKCDQMRPRRAPESIAQALALANIADYADCSRAFYPKSLGNCDILCLRDAAKCGENGVKPGSK